MLEQPKIPKSFRSRLLAFYQANKRDLPWRHTSDPYSIWVSEIMLQQTQVKTVLPRYHEFLDEFPTVADLAAATEESVCEAWAGLGYYRRARNLRKGACYVMEELGGVIPSTAGELEKIPGIGRYTAGAIASIAFGEEAPLVDGNVVRFLARYFVLPGDKEDKTLKKTLWATTTEMVKGKQPGDFNQALMEQGATICKPVAPRCGECCVQRTCQAYEEGAPETYPAPKPSAKRKSLFIAFAWHENKSGLWLEQRGLDGLWSGLWELPSGQGDTMEEALMNLSEKVSVDSSNALMTVRHILTHRNVEAVIYTLEKLPRSRASRGKRYRSPLEAPISGLARKAIVATQSVL